MHSVHVVCACIILPLAFIAWMLPAYLHFGCNWTANILPAMRSRSKKNMRHHTCSQSAEAMMQTTPASQSGKVTLWSNLLHGSKWGKEVLLLLCFQMLRFDMKCQGHTAWLALVCKNWTGCLFLCCRTKASEEVLMVQLSIAAQLMLLSCSKDLH